MGPQSEQNDSVVIEMLDAAVASLRVPEVILLDHIEWAVRRGEYWVIGGVPASGKTDLLAAVAGLMRPARGVVRLFGRELAHVHESERVQMQLRVGVVFGYGGRLFSHLTVAENLALPLCYHQNCLPEASQERVKTVLETMELTAIAHNLPAATNRNLRQRAALARALVLSPELLLLDNPFAGIDPREVRWWTRFLDKLLKGHSLLAHKPLTLVVGTDDLQPWGEHAHQFAILDQNRLTPVGTRDELLRTDIPALRELLPVGWLGK